MKRIFTLLLALLLLALSLLSMSACAKIELEGVFTTTGGENQRIYSFLNNLRHAEETNADGSYLIFNRMIVTEVINEVSFDTYFRYELREENGEEYLDLKYEGIVYEGNDIYVAHMVNALDVNHKKSPYTTKKIYRASDYIEISDNLEESETGEEKKPLRLVKA